MSDLNVNLIAAERQRQWSLGYTPEHDDAHSYEHLADLALGYLRNGQLLQVAALLTAITAKEMRANERASS